MLINLSDVLTSEGMVLEKEVVPGMTCFRKGSQEYRVLSQPPVRFTFANAGKGKALVTGKADMIFQAYCDRCLAETEVALTLDFRRTVTSSGTEDDEADDLGFMEGTHLDTEAFIHNEILVNWPAKILCRDDCRGLCPKCGQNLNMRDCGCDTFVPDPRMAVIKDIFNGNKEV